MMKKLTTTLCGLGLLALLVPACTGETGEVVDDTILEPTLDSRVNLITQKVCAAIDTCGDIGLEEDNMYDTMEDCEAAVRGQYNDLWPVAECSDDQVDADEYDRCVEQAENYTCGGDFDSYTDNCAASTVCTDAADPT